MRFNFSHVANTVLTQEAALHWLALRMVPGLGTLGTLKLLRKLKSPELIFRSSATELEAAGLSQSQARNIASGCSFEDALDQQQKLMAAGAQMIVIDDSLYPQRLREIFDPPLLLFALGRTDLLDSYSIAIVGTRSPTPYGLAASERLSADLSKAGLGIVSGMARGIDTAAHRATLDANGAAIAVFGCGVDVLYPSSNRKLYDDIAKRGLMVSEFPMGAPAYPQNFPVRNRIISGLSLGVVIVEGAQHSGSAITAKLAMDQGREVFAVPGNITSKTSWGPNLLIKEGGAKLVQEWSDITNELPVSVRCDLIARAQQEILPENGKLIAASQETAEVPLQAVARKLLNFLKVDIPQQFETLVETFGDISSSELIGALFDLEMSGLIRQLPGKNFVKVW
jgi:DNA processing protein